MELCKIGHLYSIFFLPNLTVIDMKLAYICAVFLVFFVVRTYLQGSL